MSPLTEKDIERAREFERTHKLTVQVMTFPEAGDHVEVGSRWRVKSVDEEKITFVLDPPPDW